MNPKLAVPVARLKVGDVFAIPLPDGKYAYAQFIERNKELGYLIEVFDIFSQQLLQCCNLTGSRSLFPPVFVGLRATARTGRWPRIGNMPVHEFKFPTFRSTASSAPGVYNNWWLWNGKSKWFIGSLPPEMRELEIEMVWGDELLEERIMGRRIPAMERY